MELNNAILRVSREHDIMMNYVVNFDRHLKNKAFDALFETVKDASAYFKRDLWNHFRAEETVLYPALLAAEPTYENIQLVLGLEREHGELWAAAEQLWGVFKFGGPVKGPTQGFVDDVQTFLETIKRHARTEITELFPRIAASPAATANVAAFTKKFQPSEAPGAGVVGSAAG
jgi:hemerythrin-like domain-containing protein